jgi:H/ACA ribonucleoprotein complex subunit 4
MSSRLLPFEKKQREMLVKREASTNAKYGCTPESRPTGVLVNYGIVNINKPCGPTSHQVSEYVKNILHVSKAGHSGTLDPAVHGVLPIAVGKATRVAQALLNAGKEYVGIMHLHKEIPEKQLKEVIEKHFTGTIRQRPPLKSAVKRVERSRTIYYFDILEMQDKDALFIVGCEAGTYIRKLLHDLGLKLKCGAHMAELRRTKAGPFTESTLCTLQDLADAHHYYKEESKDPYLRKVLQPIETAVSHLPKVWVLDQAVDTICHGAKLNVPGISQVHSGIEPDQTVAVMSLKNELVALGIAALTSKKMLEQEKGLAVRTDAVFMEPNTYKG